MTITVSSNVVSIGGPIMRIGLQKSLNELLQEKHETFQECLFRLIDEREMKDSEVYGKALMDRKLFSKIRTNRDYRPRKQNAIALALALELNLDETQELLGKGGWTLTSSNPFDLVIAHCIYHKIYNIVERINPILYNHNLPTLGDNASSVVHLLHTYYRITKMVFCSIGYRIEKLMDIRHN